MQEQAPTTGATKPPPQSWWTFLTNHASVIASIDFFTVPTVTFRVLYVFLVLDDARRRIIHFNVIESPSAAWTGQQIVEAFPFRIHHGRTRTSSE